MSMITVGTYGAKRQSQKRASPRDLLRRIMDEAPGSEQSAIHAKFTDIARDDPDMVDAIIEYWFANNYRSLSEAVQPAPIVQQKKEVGAAKASEYRAQVEQIAKPRIVQFVLLEMKMPNGKTLAECTFKEVAKFGGQFTALAALGKPGEKVGKLSEATVRKIIR